MVINEKNATTNFRYVELQIAVSAHAKKHVKPPEKPEKIEAMLRDPARRRHVGPWPCCVTFDGTIAGTKTWGMGNGSDDGKGGKVFECMWCRNSQAA